MIDWHEWRRYWHKRMPILDWLPEYNIKRDLKFDFIAGFTVAVMLVPQEMSFAAVMGVPAQYGLYTAALAPLLYPLFGSSRALSVANAAEGSLLVGVMLRAVEIQSIEERVATGILMTFFTGLIMICSGFLHQGGIISFFSRTSMNGYITATAFLIITSQLPGWFGITLHKSSTLTIFTLIEIIADAPHANAYSVALGIFSLGFLSVTKTLKAQLQGIAKIESATSRESVVPTATVVEDEDNDNDEVVEVYLHATDNSDPSSRLATAAVRPEPARSVPSSSLSKTPSPPPLSMIQRFLQPRPIARKLCSMLCDGSALAVCVIGMAVGATLGESNIKLTGHVPSGLPSPVFPPAALGTTIPWDRLQSIIINSFMIAVIFFMSSVATGSKLANKDGYEISPNQELLGLGFANLGASFFQGMPSTAGMSRSAVNSQSAHTPLASMITALLVIITLLFLTGPLYYLPQAPLAAIILLSAVTLIDFGEAQWLRTVKLSEFYVWLAAFSGTLGFGLLRGLGISIVASLFAIMATSKKPKVMVLGQREDGSFAELATTLGATALQDIVVVRMEHTLYFGNTTHFVHGVEKALQAAKANGRVLGAVVDGSRMNDVDASAMHALIDYSHKLAGRDQQLTFANLRPDTTAALEASGLWPQCDADSQRARDLTGDIASAIAYLRRPYGIVKANR